MPSIGMSMVSPSAPTSAPLGLGGPAETLPGLGLGHRLHAVDHAAQLFEALELGCILMCQCGTVPA